MTSENFARTLSVLVEAKPFTFFTLEMNDGSCVEIDDPRTVTWRDGTAVFLARDRRFHWFRCDKVMRIFVPSAS